MTAAGYNVSIHSFPFVFVPPSTLEQLTPIAATYPTGAPLIATTTSSASSTPAAGPSASTPDTITPETDGSPYTSASSAATFWIWTPIRGRWT